MTFKRGNDAGMHLFVGFRGVTLDEELKFLINDFRIGGIVLFKRNIETPDQLRDLLERAQSHAEQVLKRSLWVAIDQEGGPVQRLIPPFIQLPSASELAALGPQAVAEWSAKAASDMRRMGIHINFAPVLDIQPPGRPHFMEGRCLGSEPEVVSNLGKLWIGTMQEGRVSATAKHFPGLGLAEFDPHYFAPVINWTHDAAMERDLLPFHDAVKAGVHCVMTSHALYPYLDRGWPATLSPAVNDGLLRNKLGFRGVLLSDDLDMAAVSEKFTWREMAEQGLLSTIDYFLLCQNSRNIEFMFRALSDSLAARSDLAALHDASLDRIQWLFDQHGELHSGLKK